MSKTLFSTETCEQNTFLLLSNQLSFAQMHSHLDPSVSHYPTATSLCNLTSSHSHGFENCCPNGTYKYQSLHRAKFCAWS